MKLTDIKNSLNEISAIGGLKQVVKGNTDRVEGIKLSKEMAQAMIDWFNSSPYGFSFYDQYTILEKLFKKMIILYLLLNI